MEPFLVTLQPGAGSGADPVVHLGEEFVFLGSEIGSPAKRVIR
jgi:hypothetical protein